MNKKRYEILVNYYRIRRTELNETIYKSRKEIESITEEVKEMEKELKQAQKVRDTRKEK